MVGSAHLITILPVIASADPFLRKVCYQFFDFSMLTSEDMLVGHLFLFFLSHPGKTYGPYWDILFLWSLPRSCLFAGCFSVVTVRGKTQLPFCRKKYLKKKNFPHVWRNTPKQYLNSMFANFV